MEKIKFLLSETIYDAEVKRVSAHVLGLVMSDEVPQSVRESGFVVLNEHNFEIMENHEDFTTTYRMLPGEIQLSDDGSIWVPPAPILRSIEVSLGWNDMEDEDGIRPASVKVNLMGNGVKVSSTTLKAAVDWKHTFADLPDGVQYTIEVVGNIEGYEVVINGYHISATHTPVRVVRDRKIEELNQTQQAQIQYGTDVTLADGSVEHFTLTDHDQTSLTALQLQVIAGMEKIPWHTSDHTEGCKYYSNADMNTIIATCTMWVTYHVTFYRDIRRYVMSLTDATVIEAVEYDLSNLPLEFYSEVLSDIVGQMQQA